MPRSENDTFENYLLDGRLRRPGEHFLGLDVGGFKVQVPQNLARTPLRFLDDATPTASHARRTFASLMPFGQLVFCSITVLVASTAIWLFPRNSLTESTSVFRLSSLLALFSAFTIGLLFRTLIASLHNGLFRGANNEGRDGTLYGLEHALLNLEIPPKDMWMNMGYWDNDRKWAGHEL